MMIKMCFTMMKTCFKIRRWLFYDKDVFIIIFLALSDVIVRSNGVGM